MAKQQIGLVERFLNLHTRLQGTANDLARKLEALIGSTDKKVLEHIIRNLPVGSEKTIKGQMTRIEKLVSEIEKIRAVGYESALKVALDTGDKVAVYSSEGTFSVIDGTAGVRKSALKGILSKKATREIVEYAPFEGQSIPQWFNTIRQDDLTRLTQVVQRAAVEQLSVDRVKKLLLGTQEAHFKDGLFPLSRSSAVTLSRTLINGVSNSAMLETCKSNSDAIDGIKFVATLDGKTCPVCGLYDGKVWKGAEIQQAKRPPLHPNCRCCLVPYVEGGKEGERPAASADFDKLAEDAYNKAAKENGLNRRYADLSPSTRLKYYYKAQKDYEKTTGKKAYTQEGSDTTFKEYFENQPEDFKRSWLGKTRYEMYRNGSLSLENMVRPDTGYVVPVSDLKM